MRLLSWLTLLKNARRDSFQGVEVLVGMYFTLADVIGLMVGFIFEAIGVTFGTIADDLYPKKSWQDALSIYGLCSGSCCLYPRMGQYGRVNESINWLVFALVQEENFAPIEWNRSKNIQTGNIAEG